MREILFALFYKYWRMCLAFGWTYSFLCKEEFCLYCAWGCFSREPINRGMTPLIIHRRMAAIAIPGKLEENGAKATIAHEPLTAGSAAEMDGVKVTRK